MTSPGGRFQQRMDDFKPRKAGRIDVPDIGWPPKNVSRALAHEKVGHTGQGLWHDKNRQLPAFIQHIANDLIQQRGMPESEAIATAVAQCKRWAAGGPDVKPETSAKAAAAIAEWERLKAGTKATRSDPLDMSAAEDILRWSPSQARAPAGSAAGGQFAAGSGGAAPTNAKPVGQGETGHRVSDLQKRLNALGAHLAVDGKFGPKTLAAVRAFQKAHGLKVDGLVGPKTTAALRLKAHPAHHKHHAHHHRHAHHHSHSTHHHAHTAPAKAVSPQSKAPAAQPAPAAKAPAPMTKAPAHRSASMDGGYDADGLDGSWNDPSGLPDMTGLDVPDIAAADSGGDGGDAGASRMAKLGTGARFKALKSELAAKGASDPGALAAYIGAKKYGKAKFTALASKARKGKGGGMYRSELIRTYPLEDIHILTRAEGDGSGRVVEAYATVFDQEAEIHDAQGHYREVIDRSAFDQVLHRISRSPGGLAAQVKVLFNHGRTMGGVEAPEFQLPLGKPLDVRPEARGLMTRTEYDAGDPFTERILSKIHAGTITAQSFVGGIMRSTPELKGPGDKYRGRNGALTTVRRMVLGLREYGPVLYPAYTGAEILGVRMQLPGSPEDDFAPGGELDTTEVEEFAPDMEGGDTGGIPEEVHPTREHAHRLLVTRTEQMLREAGIAPLNRGW